MMIDSQSHFPRLLMLFLGAGNEHEDAKSEQKKHTNPNHNQQQQYRVNQNVPRDHHESKQRGRRVVLVRDKKASFVSIFHLRGCDNKDGLIYFFADHLFVVVLSSFSFLHSHFFPSSWTCKCHTMCISSKSLNTYFLLAYKMNRNHDECSKVKLTKTSSNKQKVCYCLLKLYKSVSISSSSFM